MPFAVQVILITAAVVSALGVLWAKVLHPGFRVARTVDQLVPLLRDFLDAQLLLREFIETFKDDPGVFLVLEEIASEFRTDSGSTLRDAINKLNDAVASLGVGADAFQRLASGDRQEVARLAVLLGQVLARVDESGAGVTRIEQAAAGVAADLEIAQSAVEGVATDLAASHDRANEAEDNQPGAAADAASRTPDT